MTELPIKTIKRLVNEDKDLNKNRMDFIQIIQADDNPLMRYFMLRPKDKPYVGGHYIGKIMLAKDYPVSPPDFIMLTPNGRFNTDSKICLTISGYHSNQWSSGAWNVLNMIKAIYSIFLADALLFRGNVYLSDVKRNIDR